MSARSKIKRAVAILDDALDRLPVFLARRHAAGVLDVSLEDAHATLVWQRLCLMVFGDEQLADQIIAAARA